MRTGRCYSKLTHTRYSREFRRNAVDQLKRCDNITAANPEAKSMT